MNGPEDRPGVPNKVGGSVGREPRTQRVAAMEMAAERVFGKDLAKIVKVNLSRPNTLVPGKDTINSVSITIEAILGRVVQPETGSMADYMSARYYIINLSKVIADRKITHNTFPVTTYKIDPVTKEKVIIDQDQGQEIEDLDKQKSDMVQALDNFANREFTDPEEHRIADALTELIFVDHNTRSRINGRLENVKTRKHELELLYSKSQKRKL